MKLVELASKVVDLVLSNSRCPCPSLRETIVEVYRQCEGADPTSELAKEISHLFWYELDRRNPDIRSQYLPPVGRGSPYYVRGELSPWQENAIRDLEERQDD